MYCKNKVASVFWALSSMVANGQDINLKDSKKWYCFDMSTLQSDQSYQSIWDILKKNKEKDILSSVTLKENQKKGNWFKGDMMSIGPAVAIHWSKDSEPLNSYAEDNALTCYRCILGKDTVDQCVGFPHGTRKLKDLDKCE